MNNITLWPTEIEQITGYSRATKQLAVLHDRGFLRAYISRKGEVVLERAHYEAVSRGELHQAPPAGGGKVANLSFIRKPA